MLPAPTSPTAPPPSSDGNSGVIVGVVIVVVIMIILIVAVMIVLVLVWYKKKLMLRKTVFLSGEYISSTTDGVELKYIGHLDTMLPVSTTVAKRDAASSTDLIEPVEAVVPLFTPTEGL